MYSRYCSYWSESETERLITMVMSGLGSGETARRLGRSQNSVLGRARRIGIRFRRKQR